MKNIHRDNSNISHATICFYILVEKYVKIFYIINTHFQIRLWKMGWWDGVFNIEYTSLKKIHLSLVY